MKGDLSQSRQQATGNSRKSNGKNFKPRIRHSGQAHAKKNANGKAAIGL